MSGGHFENKQFVLYEIAEKIEGAIYRIDREYEGYEFGYETIEKFKDAIALLKKAEIYVHRIEWLLSGDDGEVTFHERLKADLKEIK